jgi:hypothetical protein
MTKCLVFILFVVSIFVVSCSPSENSINTEIAQTQAANPTNTLEPTNTPQPTATQTATEIPTDTPTPTETPTATPTASPTPDVRIIIESSDKFLLQASDLPQDAKYFLSYTSLISPIHNSEIISALGREEGLDYLEKSGFINGWYVIYARGTRKVRAPERINHTIGQYKSSEGAQLTVKEYNISTYSDDDWELMDEEVNLGDLSLAMIYKEMQSNGKYWVWIIIDSAYRNYVSRVDGSGWEDDVSLEYVMDIAQIALDKLKSAKLSEPNWPE